MDTNGPFENQKNHRIVLDDGTAVTLLGCLVNVLHFYFDSENEFEHGDEDDQKTQLLTWLDNNGDEIVSSSAAEPNEDEIRQVIQRLTNVQVMQLGNAIMDAWHLMWNSSGEETDRQ